MNYNYIDQNNNRFSINTREATYFPTEPGESSSGVYDGGEAMTIKISYETYKEITRLADSILAATETHTLVREMRTSILSVKKGGKTIRRILKPSEMRSDLELVLRKVLH